jgi:hypothetical protein
MIASRHGKLVSIFLAVYTTLTANACAQAASAFDFIKADSGEVSFFRSKDFKAECASCRRSNTDPQCNPECFADVFSVRIVCAERAIKLELGPVTKQDKSKFASELERNTRLSFQNGDRNSSTAITATQFQLRDYDLAYNIRLSADFRPTLSEILTAMATINETFVISVGRRKYAIGGTPKTGPMLSDLLRRCAGR